MTVEQWLGENNQLGIDIWKGKYQHNNESFDDWINRVSGGNEELKGLILEKKFLFGGRILAARNTDLKACFSNCFVLPAPEDNIESIFDTAKLMARTFSYGGGVGIDIGKLRPNQAQVNNAAKCSSGAVSFMNLYSLVTETISQSGRRGALMISIPCNHPDVEEFINIKSDLNKITKANISLRVTDEFMEAAAKGEEYTLTFSVDSTGEVIEKIIDARSLFTKFCEMNWRMAEPGMLFWDRIEEQHLMTEYAPEFKLAGVNPCGEEPLSAGSSCLLGSLNLASFVQIDSRQDSYFDWDNFRWAVKIAVTGLDDVLSEGIDRLPSQMQKDAALDWRPIGLGIMGLADALIKLKITYGSKQAISFIKGLGSIMIQAAIEQSEKLGVERGSFRNYEAGKIEQSKLFKKFYYDKQLQGMRNSQLLTVAPTGTLSTMLGISGGIEPIFANSYTRKTESLHGEDVYYDVFTPIAMEYFTNNNLAPDENLLPDYFVTAQTLDFKDRIEMQAAMQNYIDASISSTVNVPNDFTVEQVMELYTRAWSAGVKGITIYRDGCERSGVLTTATSKSAESAEPQRGQVVQTHKSAVGLKRTLQTGCGTMHVTAFFNPETGELQETYFSKGSTGGCNNFMVSNSRLVSLAARAGVSVDDIIDQLKSSGACPSYAIRSATKKDTSKGSCCPVAIGNALKDMAKEIQGIIGDHMVMPVEASLDNPLCLVCGDSLVFEGGCTICKNCGNSKCD